MSTKEDAEFCDIIENYIVSRACNREYRRGFVYTQKKEKECDCGAVATYGKDAPKRVHAHWCSINDNRYSR